MADSLAIVGLGPANINAFEALVEKVEELLPFRSGTLPPKKIYLIDHEENHGAGKAWGRHAHPSMLFSDTPEGARDGLWSWLNDKDKLWLKQLEPHRHGALKTWFTHNEKALKDKQYSKIHLPRMVRGMFQREKLFEALQHIPPSLEVVMLDGKISAVKRKGDIYRLEFEHPAREVTMAKNEDGIVSVKAISEPRHQSIEVDANVIGVGPEEPSPFPKVKHHPDYFSNPTELHPRLAGENFVDQFKMAALKKYRERGRKVEIGVLGAGLSFLDVVNVIDNDDELKQAVDLTSISNSGFTRTRKEADQRDNETKEKDYARESQLALDDLQPTFIAARVNDVEPGAEGGITVKTSDEHLDEPGYIYKPGTRSPKKEHHFDMVVQTLGFGKWQEQGVFQHGLADGTYKEDARHDGPAVDADMRMAPGSYANGIAVRNQISTALERKFLSNKGFLGNIYRHRLAMATTLFDELFSKEAQHALENLGHGAIRKRPQLTRFLEPREQGAARIL